MHPIVTWRDQLHLAFLCVCCAAIILCGSFVAGLIGCEIARVARLIAGN